MQNPSRSPATFRLISAAALALSVAAPAHAAPNVIASLSQPPGGLACSEAVDQTRVVFDFKTPRSDLKQISVFVNGQGLRADEIDEEWPRLTVRHGLHPGRNTVEVYATGADNQTEAHTLTVLAGEAPGANDKEDVAIVDCIGASGDIARDAEDSGDLIAEASDDSEEVIEDVRPVIDDDVEYVDRTVYVDGPVYVYHPYPAFRFVSFFPAFYYPAPYYHYYSYRPYSHYYGRPGYYYRGGGYHRGGGHHGGYSHGSYWNPGNHAPQHPSRPPTHSGGARVSPPNRGGDRGGHDGPGRSVDRGGGGDRGGHHGGRR